MKEDPRIREIQERIAVTSRVTARLRTEVEKVIVGQTHLVSGLLSALISDGHILLEGVPGLAKTRAIKSLAAAIHAKFNRIQFTPDLLPSDLVGTRIYNQKTALFETVKGPIFGQFILADEINRAPAKVQSALLEAMEERQVTIEKETFPLESPFLVLATQNPIETEGTYPLSEAQIDRFMFKIAIGYPSVTEEREIAQRFAIDRNPLETPLIEKVATVEELLDARKLAQEIYVDPRIVDYAVRLVHATRKSSEYGLALDAYIRFGASPRATLYLVIAARSRAFLEGRAYVVPEDLRSVAPDVLRHRVIPTYEAEAEGIETETLIAEVLAGVSAP